MDAKTVGPDEVQIECGKLAREANREFRELDSKIKSLETALAAANERVRKLREELEQCLQYVPIKSMAADAIRLALSATSETETAPDALAALAEVEKDGSFDKAVEELIAVILEVEYGTDRKRRVNEAIAAVRKAREERGK
jgi:vacuolar-type H+-ATPase subunit I/STV1